jgi:hypothetical protein
MRRVIRARNDDAAFTHSDGNKLKRLLSHTESPFLGTWTLLAGGNAVLRPSNFEIETAENTAFFEAFGSIGAYSDVYSPRFCCAVASGMQQTMSDACLVTSSQITKRIANWLRFENGGNLCKSVNCPAAIILSASSGEREVMARVTTVQALRYAIAVDLKIPAISCEHILIVQVCETCSCTHFVDTVISTNH